MNGKEDGFSKFITQYKKGDTVYQIGDEQNHFYIMNKGKVQLKIEDNELILISLGKGEFFGEEALNETQLAAYTVEVVEDADIIKIPFNALTDMMKKSNAIAVKILKKLSEKNLKMIENALNLQRTATTVPKKQEKAAKAEQPSEEDDSAPLDGTIKAYLIIKRSNRIVQLTKRRTFLGRRDYTTGFIPDVDLTKEDEEKYISRKHSQIAYIDGKFYVCEEPGAVNGTFLNGNKLTTGVKHELNNEDEVTLCHLDIVFKY